MTREKYLELAFLDRNYKPGAEQEADIPKRFQLPDEDEEDPPPDPRPYAISPEELAWRRRTQRPVTGSAFADDPEAKHEGERPGTRQLMEKAKTTG